MGTVAKAGGGDFEITPAGVFPARCFSVVDLGVHKTGFTDEDGVETVSHRIRLTWELLGEERRNDDKVFVISRDFTLSLHEKSTLRPFLESWRGKAFTPEELDGFDLANLVGVYCTVQVMHDTSKAGKQYAKVAAALPFSSKEKPEAQNENIHFDIDEFDQAIFDKLSKWTQETITSSLTWQQMESKGKAPAVGGTITPSGDVVIEDISDEPINLDDIPF